VAETRFLRSLAVLNGNQAPHAYLSIEYSIYPERRLVSTRLAGRLTGRGLETYATSLRSDSRFDPTFAELMDLRQVTEILLEPDEALRLADQIDPFSLESKRAFVAHTEAQRYAARMHQLLLTGRKPISIFSSLEDATRWLCD
jgi:hypothetical protein